MSRTRVIPHTEALYVGPSDATGAHFEWEQTGVVSDSFNEAQDSNEALNAATTVAGFAAGVVNKVKQLHRIQDISYSFTSSKEDVFQFGELAARDRVLLAPPTVALSFSYVLNNFANEQSLGFIIDESATCIKNLLNKTEDEKNYFIKTSAEGVDAVGDTTNVGEAIAIGNAFVTSYSSEASVGNFPTVSVGAEGMNIVFENAVSGRFLPSIDSVTQVRSTGYTYHLPDATSNFSGIDTGISALSVIRPGDIKLTMRKRLSDSEAEASAAYDFPGVDIVNACIQSYSLSFDLSRTAIQCLGKRFPVDREIDLPSNVTLSVSALQGDLVTGNLSNFVNCDNDYDVIIDLFQPVCVGESTTLAAKYKLKNASIDSQSFSSSIGDNKTVTLDFVSQVSGPNQTTKGLFMSGDVI